VNTASATVQLIHHAFGRSLPGGEPGRANLGGSPPSGTEVQRGERLALDAVEGTDPGTTVRVLRTLSRGRCLYTRAFPAAPDLFGRPTRRFHLVWLSREELRALGNLPWRLDAQLPDLGRIAAPLGPLAVRLEAPTGTVTAPPDHWCETVAAVERLRAGEPLTFPVGSDLRFVLVWLSVVALDLPDVTLRINQREAVFTPRAVAPLDPPPGPGAVRWSRFAIAVTAVLGSLVASAAASGLFARFVPSVPTVGLLGVG
jgi:hypothetical protein